MDGCPRLRIGHSRIIQAHKSDHLKICFGGPDHIPTKFTAKAKSGQAMYCLERQKQINEGIDKGDEALSIFLLPFDFLHA